MINILSDKIINQIAAGEVIERPFSAVKELVENAIDANATDIKIHIRAGGKSYIRISDNGCGISHDDLPIAMQRHATSKLDENNLFAIKSLGFRGEALPSIGSVSRMNIASRVKGADEAWQITTEGGTMSDVFPAVSPQKHGTIVEVKDLFYATPARLKFMRSDRAENAAIIDVINRLAMAYPHVAFSLFDGEKKRLDYAPHQATLGEEKSSEESFLFRLRQVMGTDFSENAMKLNAEKQDIKLTGYAGLPTLNRATSMMQFLFVNGRPIKDRQMLGAVRAAYADFLARNRHPLIALYIELDPALVDVNVHPQKTDVRFRDAAAVRGLLVSGIRHALGEAGFRASGTVAQTAMGYARTAASPYARAGAGAGAGGSPPPASYQPSQNFGFSPGGAVRSGASPSIGDSYGTRQDESYQQAETPQQNYESAQDYQSSSEEFPQDFPLGAAMAQLHENYVIAQTEDGIVIVDQHAAHERILYEKMKTMLEEGKVAGQGLLSPEVVDLGEEQAIQLLQYADDFASLGLVIESFGPGAIAVRQTPAILGVVDVHGLIRDLADEILEYGSGFILKEKLQDVFGTMACHSAIRSGRRLLPDEMNALLREMESTPHAGQCNHGRPTYVELKLKDIEVLFGRR